MAIILDTFTEATDTHLSVHTPDSGDAAGWTSVDAPWVDCIGGAGYAQSISGGKRPIVDDTPSSANYWVKANFNLGGATSSERFYLYARYTHTGSYGYRAYVFGSNVFRVVCAYNGGSYTIANLDGTLSALTSDHSMKIQVEETGSQTTVNVWWDDALVVTDYADTNANRVTSADPPGFGVESTTEVVYDFEADYLSAGASIIPQAAHYYRMIQG